ncbi:MAG: excinuclease ABC subunit UvrC [Clostridia bacterium]|nr:excinuclease ABC subunit UvrC [Clostridia bacterium]
MFCIEEELKKLPDKPGVYIMRDKENHIIYVGKAISLKNRVRQYFRKNNKTKRIENMVALVDHFEYIVTDNESEALILECNLIKKNMPKFNVLLKDDKTYPYIKITTKEEFPRVFTTRKILNDGARYFGPYASSGAANEMLDFIRSRYQIRQCKVFKSRAKPCLNYQIKKCSAPCAGKISKEEYREEINQIIGLLEGKTAKVIKQLEEEIQKAAEKLEFEKAAMLRDKKFAIQRITEEKQKVSNLSEHDIDVIGLARSPFHICMELFLIRNSKMIERHHYFLDDLQDETDKEILSNFLKQHYIGEMLLPNKIMIKEEIEDKELLEQWLSQMAGRKVEIKTPQKGEKLKLVTMAENNAQITLTNKEREKYQAVKELQEILHLKKIPRKIEGYDISNLSGQFIVASMCVLQDGEVKKYLSRNFKIKTVLGQDDPRCMNEVITRRLRHSIRKKDKAFGELPDVIFVDGGVTQIHAAKQAVAELNLKLPIYGMVKDDKHSTRALINENREEIPLSEELMKLITYFQDCIHDKAISYHRSLRDKEITRSDLDGIDGIGEARKKELLKKFGSVAKIKEASLEEMIEIPGITIELAQRIKEELKNERKR